MLLVRNASVRLLFAGQALYWGCSIIGITLTSIVGARLAPWPALATLPLALLVLGNLLSVQPLSLFMQRHGRRAGLQAGALCGVAGGLISMAGVQWGSFAVFCAGTLAIGAYQASSGYYTYAALEAVDAQQKAGPPPVWWRAACARPFSPHPWRYGRATCWPRRWPAPTWRLPCWPRWAGR